MILVLQKAVDEFDLPLLQVVGPHGKLPEPALEYGAGGFRIIHPFAAHPAKQPAGPMPSAALLYSSYFGSNGQDWVQDMAIDRKGTVYLTGLSYDPTDFPTTPGSFQTNTGGSGIFTAKFSRLRLEPVYIAFFDAGSTIPNSIAVDSKGAAYIGGWTIECEFPATAGAFDTVVENCADKHDPFIIKLTPDGTALAYATLLGGSGDELGEQVIVDSKGQAIIAGLAWDDSVPVTPGSYDTSFSHRDIFIAKLNADGSGLVFATYLGGDTDDAWDVLGDMTLDRKNRIYLTGSTTSGDFPVTPGSLDTHLDGYNDAFVVRLSSAGTALEYGTLIGGGGASEIGYNIAVDRSGAIYVAGETGSEDFPTTPNALDAVCEVCEGYRDIFVVKINPSGGEFDFSTLFGGSGFDKVNGLGIDPKGAVWLAGSATSVDFPITANAVDPIHSGYYEGFVSQLSPDGSALLYGTFLGGSDDDGCQSMAVDRSGFVYVSGFTYSVDFPVTTQAFDPVFNGYVDAFLAQLSADPTRPHNQP